MLQASRAKSSPKDSTIFVASRRGNHAAFKREMCSPEYRVTDRRGGGAEHTMKPIPEMLHSRSFTMLIYGIVGAPWIRKFPTFSFEFSILFCRKVVGETWTNFAIRPLPIKAEEQCRKWMIGNRSVADVELAPIEVQKEEWGEEQEVWKHQWRRRRRQQYRRVLEQV